MSNVDEKFVENYGNPKKKKLWTFNFPSRQKFLQFFLI